MNTKDVKKTDLITVQDFPEQKMCKLRVKLLENQSLFENEFAFLIKKCAEMKNMHPNTSFTFGARDSDGYMFWINYLDLKRALFLEDLEVQSFMAETFKTFFATCPYHFKCTGLLNAGMIVDIIFRKNKFMNMPR